jgi:hypothetical protein
MKSRLSQNCQALFEYLLKLGDSTWWVDVSPAIGDHDEMSAVVKQRWALLFVPLMWVWASFSQGSDKLHELGERASAAMQRNDFVEAEKAYRAILAIAPQLAEMRNWDLLFICKTIQQAERSFAKLSELSNFRAQLFREFNCSD